MILLAAVTAIYGYLTVIAAETAAGSGWRCSRAMAGGHDHRDRAHVRIQLSRRLSSVVVARDPQLAWVS